MKKAVSIILACCILITVFVTAVGAETGNVVGSGNSELEAAIAAVGDKLDPSVIECLYNSTGYGTSFVIQYHGVTRDELFIQINRLTSMKILNVDLGAGKAVFGLPYSSIVRVAGLDCVDYITLFGKITPALQAKLNVMDDDDVIETWIEAYYIAYTDADIIAQTEEICGFKESEIKTNEQSNLFYSTRIHLINEADHNKVMEIFQKAGINYSDVVGGWDPDDVLDSWTGRYILTKAQILQASTLEEIALIDTYHKQDSPPDFYEPTSVPTEVPSEAPTEADDDFLGYPIDHWTNNVLIFCNTDGIFTSATVRYIEDGSGVWKSAQMTYGGKNEYNESFWYFTMPLKKCRYYITDGTHRTQEDYFTHETLLFLMNETDENGYYNLCLDSYAANEPSYLYRDKLKERYNLSEFDGDFYTYQLMGYQELYYHRDGKGDIDWALIQCYCNIESPIEMTAIVGNRVLHPGTEYYPFSTTYGIYDVKNDKFIDACTSGAYLSEAYNYDGFVRAFDEIVGGGMGWSLADHDNAGKGRPLGDIDNDFDLSIVDVTMIQRCEAMIADYPATDVYNVTYDYKGNPHYCSDFNLDGSRDIVDATCIQRYLVGMDYPIG